MGPDPGDAPAETTASANKTVTTSRLTTEPRFAFMGLLLVILASLPGGTPILPYHPPNPTTQGPTFLHTFNHPRRIASTTASVRLLASSFANEFSTWKATVHSLIPDSFPMRLLVHPFATSLSTSRSRSVSPAGRSPRAQADT